MYIKGSDTRMSFKFQHSDGTVLNLADADITLELQKPDNTKITLPVSVQDENTGTCSILLAAVVLDQCGTYQYQTIIVYKAGGTVKSNIQSFFVEDSLDE